MNDSTKPLVRLVPDLSDNMAGAGADAAQCLPRRYVPVGDPRILVILHQETSTPGRVGMRLVKRGYRLDIRRPRFGDPLPETLDAHAGAIIFGGPMSANDGDEFVAREIDWIGVPLAQQKPFLGICLGAQMLAMHLGAAVAPHEQGRVEIGYFPLRPTDDGQKMMQWPGHVYQWHTEDFSLPAGACLLARGLDGRNQAMRVGKNAYGVQFHPEVTRVMMHRWVVSGAHRFALDGAQPRRAHLDGRLLHDRQINAWLDRFLDRWLG